eukprot:6203562-Pleurochrysis_carterae.AAC.2
MGRACTRPVHCVCLRKPACKFWAHMFRERQLRAAAPRAKLSTTTTTTTTTIMMKVGTIVHVVSRIQSRTRGCTCRPHANLTMRQGMLQRCAQNERDLHLDCYVLPRVRPCPACSPSDALQFAEAP